MDTFTNDTDDRAAAATSFDRTVSYFLITVGIVMGFLVMLSIFLQVNRVTTEPSLDDTPPTQPNRPDRLEIGKAADPQTN